MEDIHRHSQVHPSLLRCDRCDHIRQRCEACHLDRLAFADSRDPCPVLRTRLVAGSNWGLQQDSDQGLPLESDVWEGSQASDLQLQSEARLAASQGMGRRIEGSYKLVMLGVGIQAFGVVEVNTRHTGQLAVDLCPTADSSLADDGRPYNCGTYTAFQGSAVDIIPVKLAYRHCCAVV